MKVLSNFAKQKETKRKKNQRNIIEQIEKLVKKKS